ncbi:hypothetical protein HDV00_007488 [Rhizophlyctis rosea]|nr:hypothetical protein HDV00_007488 [Rhizophlyctis rosea]
MSEVHQRKKVDASTAPAGPAAHSSKTKPTTQRGTTLRNIILFLGLTLFLAAATSYIITDTLTFGQKLPNWRKYIPAKEKTFTTKELAQYDGSDLSKPIYLAINGKVYDVTVGRKHYGPGGSYGTFSGKDAARAYITGCFQTHLTHDLRGLSEKEIQQLDHWINFYANHKEYFYVGRVIHDPIDPNSPIPESCYNS